MTVTEFAEKLNGRIITGEINKANQVTGIYCCDLLSWVMSHVNKGEGWITVHTNLNIIAVAALSELSCIIVPEGIEVNKATIDKAIEQGVPIISTDLNSYKICSIAHSCGL